MPKKSKKSSKKPSEKLKKVDWLGLDHKAVSKHFEDSPKFVNYMNVGTNGDLVAAVYHSKTPNLKKGHKEFMLLWQHPSNGLMVSGMEREEVEKHAHVSGMKCLDCGTVLWSLNRHHFHSCGCPNDMFVDGGKDYLRAGAMSMQKTLPVRINLLTDEITLDAANLLK